jgi:anti-anti-sigma factor
MQVSDELADGATIVVVNGRIDSTTSASLDEHLAKLGQQGVSRVVVDLSGVDYISSAGLRVMLALAKRTKQGQGRLALCGLNDAVRQVFSLAGFLPLFTVEATRELALSRTAAA